MSEILIKDQDFQSLKGKVVIVTGGSSGIGLATVELLLANGAVVVNADLIAPATSPSGSYTFIQTDVTSWPQLNALFKKTKAQHSRIDHVFLNAGLGPRTDYLATDVDENGDLKEPPTTLLDVSLKGVMNTGTLAIYYMRQQPEGGSIVVNASVMGIQRCRAVDYATAKGAVYAYARGLHPLLASASIPIRVNTLAPTWAESAVLPGMRELMDKLGVELQPASAVARAAALLMADSSRNGQAIHVQCGKYQEIDEAVLFPAVDKIRGLNYPSEDEVLRRALTVLGGGEA
ncbi:hypothetical protein N0V93_007957 [Gnomoniopsis smithogilvyi]|uniref:Short-chain dehydrogenase n=1 Tax=Gnomoniopsis smithogilvyi TaxID=1191159 RepID=A0A9W8YMA9_9PEZI|nr:hypothetical protein N0V93_007957 [Gnomoniopsis smithogilvyi]